MILISFGQILENKKLWTDLQIFFVLNLINWIYNFCFNIKGYLNFPTKIILVHNFFSSLSTLKCKFLWHTTETSPLKLQDLKSSHYVENTTDKQLETFLFFIQLKKDWLFMYIMTKRKVVNKLAFFIFL